MANGGVIAPVGLNMVALAAQKHAVPFVVLAGSHKVIWHNNWSTCLIVLAVSKQTNFLQLSYLNCLLCLWKLNG